jgi:hypothetical protein
VISASYELQHEFVTEILWNHLTENEVSSESTKK